jgi:hypothetical protein
MSAGVLEIVQKEDGECILTRQNVSLEMLVSRKRLPAVCAEDHFRSRTRVVLWSKKLSSGSKLGAVSRAGQELRWVK